MNVKNKNLQTQSSNGQTKNEAELLSPMQSEPLINAKIIQILIEKNDPKDVEFLMNAEIKYNKERLEVLRENAELHPDAKEERRAKKFRRTQYTCLMILLACLVVAAPFVPLSVGAMFGILCILIVSGVLLNGREREIDLASFVKIINTIAGRTK